MEVLRLQQMSREDLSFCMGPCHKTLPSPWPFHKVSIREPACSKQGEILTRHIFDTINIEVSLGEYFHQFQSYSAFERHLFVICVIYLLLMHCSRQLWAMVATTHQLLERSALAKKQQCGRHETMFAMSRRRQCSKASPRSLLQWSRLLIPTLRCKSCFRFLLNPPCRNHLSCLGACCHRKSICV